MSAPVTVLKFGSSALRSDDHLPSAVQEIYRYVRLGCRVIAVVSAFENHTNRLLQKAQQFGEPRADALAPLLATGEQQTAALLTMALDRVGIPARLVGPREAQFTTEGPQLDAVPISIDLDYLQQAFTEISVLVMPGFIGQSQDGRLTLLGRGGSDLSALAIARLLKARRCRLIKDVDGVYEWDPVKKSTTPRRYRNINWDQAMEVAGELVQPKALEYAKDGRQNFEIAGFGEADCTVVSAGHVSFAEETTRRPIRVALLGLGCVGSGVYSHLQRCPELFRVVSIAVRDIVKHSDFAPNSLLTNDFNAAVNAPSDLVIETLNGAYPAFELLESALRSRRDVVTANKAVIAEHGVRLASIANSNQTSLQFSASVGGSVPVLETIQRLGPHTILRIDGVLSGTCNFVLDRLSEGASLEEAVVAAQARGFAEVNPTDDLDGHDILRKLQVIAHSCFARELSRGQVEREGIRQISPTDVRNAADKNKKLCLIGSLIADGKTLRARIKPVYLPQAHFLAGALNEENRLEIRTANAETHRLAGKGAGQWPTSEAVMADVWDIYRRRCKSTYQPFSGIHDSGMIAKTANSLQLPW